MSKVAFYLARPNSTTPTTIQLVYHCDDAPLKYPTGESIYPKDWSTKSQTTHRKGIRDHLARLSEFVDTIADKARSDGRKLYKADLKAGLDHMRKEHEEAAETKGLLFSDACDSIFRQMQSGEILTPKEKKYSPGSIKSFRFTASFIEKFSPGIRLSEINMATYRRFIAWCHEKSHSTNYIGSQIKNWKTLARLAGYTLPAGFKKIVEETYDVYLNEQEITAIYELQLSPPESLYRDWFIIGCYTGLRISDLVLLEEKNIDGKYITIANEKTDAKVVIPVHPRVKAIFKKYKGVPPKIYDQDLNKAIKRIAKTAGITRNVLFSITKGGKREDHYLKKYEMVSAHTARRALITNLRKIGTADSIIMKLTGIKSAQTLQRYDKMTPDEAAEIAAGMDYFKE